MPPQSVRPNVLILHADQHRWDCLGACGNPDIRTPNIDALAADGVTYTSSFCTLPVCTPSRYSLITGLYVHQHLGWNNHCTIPQGLATFPRMLRDAGYRTTAVGKMHYTPTYLDVGFERMLLAEQDGPGRLDDDYHRYLRDRGLLDRLDLIDQVREFREGAPDDYWRTFGAMTSDLPEAHHSTTWIGDRAVETLDGWTADGGNLLMVGFIKPHHPFDPPARWAGMYDPQRLSILPGWTEQQPAADAARGRRYFRDDLLDEATLRRVMAYYYATISQIDHHVGRMIDRLRARGLYDKTLILYTSDHGDFMGFHHMILKGNYLYDPLVKVPLIVKWPGRGPRGDVCDELVSNVDIATTVLKQAGLEPSQFMRGLDLATEAGGRQFVFAEGIGAEEYMVRSKTRKLLLCRQPDRSQFFDLEADPLELDNLYADPSRQAEVAELAGLLMRWSLFDAPTRTHLDEHAPRIAQPNVPPLDDGHRDELQAYFRQKLSQDDHWARGNDP